MIRAAVIIPVYGRHDLTTDVLQELSREGDLCDVWIVDNKGDFEAGERAVEIVRPGSNLGWCRGCNHGASAALKFGYEAIVLLNNDVHLSRSFVNGLLEAMDATDGDMIGPCYDHNWPQQRGSYTDAAFGYTANSTDRRVPFIDGTCMLIRRSVFERVGFLDEISWPLHGWGCDKDLALRVRAAGGSIWVTERSYLNHLARQTAAQIPGFSEEEAEAENDKGMQEKWGKTWRERLYDGFGEISPLGLVQLRLAQRGAHATNEID